MFEGYREQLRGELDEIRQAGTYKDERVISSPQGAAIRVPQGEVLNFCANNYLGLADHPEVIAAAHAARSTRCGFGMSSVRFICGTQDLHKQLEREDRRASSAPTTPSSTPSCFDANGGLFETAARRGGRDHLRRAQPRLDHRRRPPVQGRALPLRATATWPTSRRSSRRPQPTAPASSLIATDGVFSHGRRHRPARRDLRPGRASTTRWCMVDDCHATGFVGADRPRHARALRRPWAGSTSSPARSARRSAAPRAASPPAGRRSSTCCASARGPTCSPTRLPPPIVGRRHRGLRPAVGDDRAARHG